MPRPHAVARASDSVSVRERPAVWSAQAQTAASTAASRAAATAIATATACGLLLFLRRGPTTATDHGNCDLQQFLDVFQLAHLIRRAEGNRLPFAARTGGPPDAVDIAFRHIRQVVVVNEAHAWNVNTAGRNVRCHKDFQVARLERC